MIFTSFKASCKFLCPKILEQNLAELKMLRQLIVVLLLALHCAKARPSQGNPFEGLEIPANVRQYVSALRAKFPQMEQPIELEQEQLDEFESERQFPAECGPFVEQLSARLEAYFGAALGEPAAAERGVQLDFADQAADYSLLESAAYRELADAKDVCMVVKPELWWSWLERAAAAPDSSESESESESKSDE